MALSRRNALILGGVGLVTVGAGAIIGTRLLESSSGIAALQDARFSDLQGRTRTLSEWRGKPLVCNFWATWCPPCREEIPLLSSERSRVVENGGEIVGIALDTTKNVAEFTKSVKISYPILVADTSAIELMRKLGNASGGLPYTLFLNRGGSVASRKLGMLRKADLDSRLRDLLGA